MNRPDAHALTPGSVALIGLLLGIAFAVSGLASAGWDPDAFVRARDGVASAELNGSGDPIGYDGQFFYRLARAPFDPSPSVAGIELDRPAYRHQRIGYPLLAWLMAGGRAAAVPWTLIVVNVLALAVLAGAGAMIARRYERSAVWGAALLLWPGFLIALRLDLADVLAAALLMLGLARLPRRDAPWWLAGAALTRETALIVPLAYGVIWFVTRIRAHRTETKLTFAAIPLSAWLVWQGVCFAWYGKLGVLDSVTTGAPFRAVATSFARLLANGDGISLVALCATVVLASAMVLRTRSSEAPSAVRAAVLVAAAILFTRNWAVWTWWQGYTRAAIDIVLLGFVVLLAGKRSRDRVIVIPQTGDRVIQLDETPLQVR